MKTFNVSLPLVAEICTQVEAETAEQAIQIAMERYPGIKTLDAAAKEDGAPELDWFVNEGSTHKHVVRGNVYYGCIREASAELEYSDEEYES